jgi:hypothetical protein
MTSPLRQACPQLGNLNFKIYYGISGMYQLKTPYVLQIWKWNLRRSIEPAWFRSPARQLHPHLCPFCNNIPQIMEIIQRLRTPRPRAAMRGPFQSSLFSWLLTWQCRCTHASSRDAYHACAHYTTLTRISDLAKTFLGFFFISLIGELLIWIVVIACVCVWCDCGVVWRYWVDLFFASIDLLSKIK